MSEVLRVVMRDFGTYGNCQGQCMRALLLQLPYSHGTFCVVGISVRFTERMDIQSLKNERKITAHMSTYGTRAHAELHVLCCWHFLTFQITYGNSKLDE